jgi:hypothetical protein
MIPTFVKLLGEGDWPTRWASALALERLGQRAAGTGEALGNMLLGAVSRQSPGEIELAAGLLHRCAPDVLPSVAAPLSERLGSGDRGVARHACIAVERLGPSLAATRTTLDAIATADDSWLAEHARRAAAALTRDAGWMPLPMQGLRPLQLDYADAGNARSEKVRDEQW